MKYQTLIEYVLLIALAAFVAVNLYGPVGRDLNRTFADVGSKLEATVNGR